jgi:hypothetical protein
MPRDCALFAILSPKERGAGIESGDSAKTQQIQNLPRRSVLSGNPQPVVTVWFIEDAVAAWHAPATGERGGQPIHSAIAIETGLALRLVFHQPLRQTDGLLRSIADVLGIAIAIPDHTTLSRGLTISPKRVGRAEPLHLPVDSAGLKIHGEGEWLDQKHGIRSRRRWREPHFGVDADTHEIVAVELTSDDVGDVSEMPDLLDQIDADIASMTADGAYDGEAVYDAVAERHPEAAVIIPPQATTVASETTARPTSRNDCQAWAYGLATSFRLQPPEFGRNGDVSL